MSRGNLLRNRTGYLYQKQLGCDSAEGENTGHVEESGDPDEIYKKGGIYKDIIDASARSLNIEKIARTIDDAQSSSHK